MTALVVRRVASWEGKLAAYKIIIDGQERGGIEPVSEQRFTMAPGRHTIEIRTSWLSSPPFETLIQDGQIEIVDFGSNATPWTAIYYVFIKPDQYFWIKKTSGK